MSYVVPAGSPHADGALGVPVLVVDQNGAYRPLGLTNEPDAFNTDELHVPAAATAAVITFPAAGVEQAHVLSGIAYSYSATPTGGRLTIADGSETVFDIDIVEAGEKVIQFNPPRRGRPGRALTITLASGGGTVQGKVNVLAHWVIRQLVLGEFRLSDDTESGLIPLLF